MRVNSQKFLSRVLYQAFKKMVKAKGNPGNGAQIATFSNMDPDISDTGSLSMKTLLIKTDYR